MTAIWQQESPGGEWALLTPAGFPDEKTLHDLVLVLDEAPDDLVRLVGYLETVTSGLSVDLVTVAAYEIGDRRVMVPQRVEPERRQHQETEPVEANRPGRPRTGDRIPGVEPFRAQLATAPSDRRPALDQFAAWAQRLVDEKLAEVSTYFGKRGEVVLVPGLLPERTGLVSLYRWTDDSAVLSLWRSVFERRAPQSIERVESLIAPIPLGKGNTVYDVSDDLLVALYEAYREANGTRGEPVVRSHSDGAEWDLMWHPRECRQSGAGAGS